METLLDILHKIKKLATKHTAPKTIAYSTEVLCKLLLRSPSLTHLIHNPLLPIPEQAPVLQMERMCNQQCRSDAETLEETGTTDTNESINLLNP